MVSDHTPTDTSGSKAAATRANANREGMLRRRMSVVFTWRSADSPHGEVCERKPVTHASHGPDGWPVAAVEWSQSKAMAEKGFLLEPESASIAEADRRWASVSACRTGGPLQHAHSQERLVEIALQNVRL